MIRLTIIALLGATFAVPAWADGDGKPKTIAELIKRAEARIAGGGAKPNPKTGEEVKPTPREKVEVDDRPLAARAADAKRLSQELIDETLDESTANDKLQTFKKLDIPAIAVYLGPLLTGGGHNKIKVKIAWATVAHYARDVYAGKPIGTRMTPYGQIHDKYRAWCAKQMGADETLRRFVKSRVSEATNLAKSLSRTSSEDEATMIKTKLLAAGEEAIAVNMWQILWKRASEMADDDLRRTKPVGVVASDLFKFYSDIDLDKLRADNRKKLKRRSREALKKNWQTTLRQGVGMLMSKAKSSNYFKMLRR